MKNIKSLYFHIRENSTIMCESKEDFLQAISEEIDRTDNDGFDHFEITLAPECYDEELR